jgi:asparagine synthase (glutamine-hydrolysing)
MADAMVLRGPDEWGEYVDGHIGLAHRRLSIIDLTTGSQPMFSPDKQCVIVFNGEIYNFQEIRAQMEKEGVAFVTTSDTEVLLNGYLHYGIDKLLSLVDGMFAFAIYDRRLQKVFLARDRFGEKPLYYIAKEDSFQFASELKAFHPSSKTFEIDPVGLNLYMSLLYIPAPYTIYQGIRKLEQGTYLEITPDCHVTQHVYYDLIAETKRPDPTMSYEDAKQRLRELMFDSVKHRMVADVPMGAFLSGGLDSSVICCVMSQLSKEPINTFSIGYREKEYDETDRALAVSRHIHSNHTQFTLKFEDVLPILDDTLVYYDEPFSDPSEVPTYVVAKLAREKVKVVLTGDTADELFGGYPKYHNWQMLKDFRAVPSAVRSLIGLGVKCLPKTSKTATLKRNAQRMVEYARMSESDAYFSSMCRGGSDSYRTRLIRPTYYRELRPLFRDRYARFDQMSTFQKESVWDVLTLLEGQMIPKVDRACMHVSLENRIPFLDRRLVEFAMSLPDHFKIQGKEMKRILWDAFEDILPTEILKLPKKGFGVPIDHWLKNELRADFERLTSREYLDAQGIFNYDVVHQMFEDHLRGLCNNMLYLWNIYVFQKWYSKVYCVE